MLGVYNEMDKVKKPILCVDFDGVIHSYTSGWKGPEVILDPPVKGAFAFLTEALEFFTVAIYSSRSQTEAGRNAMLFWFLHHGFPHTGQLVFPEHKPAAFVTLDDRAVYFTGLFPSIDGLRRFKTWREKQAKKE